MRKFLYIMVLTTLAIINATKVNAANDAYYINSENIEMTEQEYNNLLGLGFSENQIYLMDYQTFMDNKDIAATLLSQTHQYVKHTITIRNGIRHYTTQSVSEMEYLNHSQQGMQMNMGGNGGYSPNTSGNYYDGITMDEYQVLTMMISNVDDDTMRYKLDFEWDEMPSTRSFDIIGIGIEASKVQIDPSIIFRQDWITTGNDHYYSTAYASKEESTGGSAMFQLPSGSLRSLTAYIYFEVSKQPNVGTITSLVATGDYSHAITTIADEDDAYNYYTVNYIAGIEVDTPYANSYLNSVEAEAYFVGTW